MHESAMDLTFNTLPKGAIADNVLEKQSMGNKTPLCHVGSGSQFELYHLTTW